MIKIVAVDELGVNNGSGDGGSCFGIEVWTDTAKLTNMIIEKFGERRDQSISQFIKSKRTLLHSSSGSGPGFTLTC